MRLLYRITFDPMQKCSFSLALTPYLYSFGAVQVQNCSSFLAGTKLYLIAGKKLYRIAGTKLYRIAGTKLYRIALSNVNAWLIRNTYPYRIKKVIWYSVNAAKKKLRSITNFTAHSIHRKSDATLRSFLRGLYFHDGVPLFTDCIFNAHV